MPGAQERVSTPISSWVVDGYYGKHPAGGECDADFGAGLVKSLPPLPPLLLALLESDCGRRQ